jgi:formiminoglutamase
MLENWFSPLSADALGINTLRPDQLGKQIRMYEEGQLPDLKQVQLALVGIGDKDANAVRKAFYALSFPFEGLQLVDLGNLRNPNQGFIIPALTELLNSGILPIVIGNDADSFLAQYKSAQNMLQFINLALVDERIRIGLPAKAAADQWDEIFTAESSKLFHFGLIGVQTHFTPPFAFHFLEENNFDCIRLGNARANLTDLEAVVRDSDLMAFNLAAIKQADAPGQKQPSPSGFSIEEACQICRYAGFSDKLTSFGIYGYTASLDRKNQTAQACAQMAWYFIDGYFNRKGDFPVSTDGLVEYIVDSKKLAYQLVFWKSQKSGRWWIQVPVKTRKKQLQRHRLIPCSYNDYKQACQEELPDRLINAFKRFL